MNTIEHFKPKWHLKRRIIEELNQREQGSALPGRNFNPTAGLDSPEKEITGSIDEEDVQEDVGSFHNDNDDNDSLEEHIFSTGSAKVPSISSSSSSNQNTPTSIPSKSSNSSSAKKSSTKSSPDTTEVSSFSSIHVSSPVEKKDLAIGMVNIAESFYLIG